mmetsp:Transcript_26008/g.42653  ORF Transcript_26008/g.42653 Transcript_26008/m.42653 type:complete len:94 (+) Transcript_26008:151-432(+)
MTGNVHVQNDWVYTRKEETSTSSYKTHLDDVFVFIFNSACYMKESESETCACCMDHILEEIVFHSHLPDMNHVHIHDHGRDHETDPGLQHISH